MKDLSAESIRWIREGEGVSAAGRVPEDMELFQDHFPGFPVLPGVLSMEILKDAACLYCREKFPASGHYLLKSVEAVKFSGFLKPGDSWEAELKLLAAGENETRWRGKLSRGNEKVVTAVLVIQALN